MSSLEIEDTPMPEYEDPAGVVPAGHGVYLDYNLIGVIRRRDNNSWDAIRLGATIPGITLTDKWDAALWLVRLKSSPSL